MVLDALLAREPSSSEMARSYRVRGQARGRPAQPPSPRIPSFSRTNAP